ncbi:MAG: hypothetical protein DME76_14230 [Verrucomicrobia bacterium]|nr:MAG: hypothetical protein DME76_14230 [Verrucomicrobiota bacterium]
MSFGFRHSGRLPDLAGIGDRREALAKLRLLSLSFPSLQRLAGRLLGVRTRGIKNMKVASFFIE